MALTADQLFASALFPSFSSSATPPLPFGGPRSYGDLDGGACWGASRVSTGVSRYEGVSEEAAGAGGGVGDRADEPRRGANMTERVPVPSSEHVAEIVGRQGCKIKALRSKTNTYIKTPARGEQSVFVVTGRQEDVTAAKREIISAADHFSQIRASRRHQGGSSGGSSNGGQPPADPPPATGTGTGKGTAPASRASSSSTPSTGSTSGPASPAAGAAPPSEGGGQVSIGVRVPDNVVGLVVGPKGATIKRIQQDTDTYIVTPGRDKDPVFEVIGSRANAEAARRQIESYIETRVGGVGLGEGRNGDERCPVPEAVATGIEHWAEARVEGAQAEKISSEERNGFGTRANGVDNKQRFDFNQNQGAVDVFSTMLSPDAPLFGHSAAFKASSVGQRCGPISTPYFSPSTSATAAGSPGNSPAADTGITWNYSSRNGHKNPLGDHWFDSQHPLLYTDEFLPRAADQCWTDRLFGGTASSFGVSSNGSNPIGYSAQDLSFQLNKRGYNAGALGNGYGSVRYSDPSGSSQSATPWPFVNPEFDDSLGLGRRDGDTGSVGVTRARGGAFLGGAGLEGAADEEDDPSSSLGHTINQITNFLETSLPLGRGCGGKVAAGGHLGGSYSPSSSPTESSASTGSTG